MEFQRNQHKKTTQKNMKTRKPNKRENKLYLALRIFKCDVRCNNNKKLTNIYIDIFIYVKKEKHKKKQLEK